MLGQKNNNDIILDILKLGNIQINEIKIQSKKNTKIS